MSSMSNNLITNFPSCLSISQCSVLKSDLESHVRGYFDEKPQAFNIVREASMYRSVGVQGSMVVSRPSVAACWISTSHNIINWASLKGL